eukprot:m51a1_g7287 Cell cycle checkpoint protein rad1 (361) ;mRNA; r:45001-46210
MASTGATGADGTAQQVEVEYAFWCKIDNVRVVTTVLSTIYAAGRPGSSSSSSRAAADAPLVAATVTITKPGLKFTINESRLYVANAFLTRDTPTDNNAADTLQQQHRRQFVFRVNFGVLMECLSIFGGGLTLPGLGGGGFTAMQMGYQGYGSDLVVLLEEGGVRTQCSIRTLDMPDLAAGGGPVVDWSSSPDADAALGPAAPRACPSFRDSECTGEIIVDAEVMREAFGEIDWNGDTATLHLSPDAPYFRLSSDGVCGTCEIEYSKDSEVFERFRCSRTQVTRYRLSALQPTVRALAVARKTKLSVNAEGMLSMQHMIQTEDKRVSFVDFLILPDRGVDDQMYDSQGDDLRTAPAPLARK